MLQAITGTAQLNNFVIATLTQARYSQKSRSGEIKTQEIISKLLQKFVFKR